MGLSNSYFNSDVSFSPCNGMSPSSVIIANADEDAACGSGDLIQVSVSCNSRSVWGVSHSDKGTVWYMDTLGEVRDGNSGKICGFRGRFRRLCALVRRKLWVSDYVPWKKIEFPGSDMKWVSVSGDGRSVWGVTTSNAIYYHAVDVSGENLVVSGDWTLIPGGLMQISVSGDGSEVWGVNSDDEIFYRAVDTTSPATVAGGKWELMSGRMTQVDVASIGSCCKGSPMYPNNAAQFNTKCQSKKDKNCCLLNEKKKEQR